VLTLHAEAKAADQLKGFVFASSTAPSIVQLHTFSYKDKSGAEELHRPTIVYCRSPAPASVILMQFFHWRAAQIPRTYENCAIPAEGAVEGDDDVLFEYFDGGALKLF
jgi:hypothetical protein